MRYTRVASDAKRQLRAMIKFVPRCQKRTSLTFLESWWAFHSL